MHHILYHDHCCDGFAAAFAFYQRFGADPKQFAYHPVSHGKAPPKSIERSDSVTLVDFCFPDAIMDWLADNTHELVVIDHHGTASATCQRLQETKRNCTVVFDRNKSGCVLAWQYLFGPNDPPPWFFGWIQARDLGYAWTRPELCHPQIHTLYAGLWLASPRSFQHWAVLSLCLQAEAERLLLQKGMIAEQARDISLTELVGNAHNIAIGGLSIVAVNSPLHQSELGHALIETYHCMVSLVWFITGPAADHVKLSFRGYTKLGLHLGSWCRAEWGPEAGGHHLAAGATIPLETFLSYPRRALTTAQLTAQNPLP